MADHYLKGTLDRLEGETAVIILDNGAELLWPREKLPATANTEGASVKLRLEPNPAQENKAAQTAKDFLNDILRN